MEAVALSHLTFLYKSEVAWAFVFNLTAGLRNLKYLLSKDLHLEWCHLYMGCLKKLVFNIKTVHILHSYL